MVITQNGVTALKLASQEGHVTVVRLLLEKGADVNICDEVVMDFVSCTCMWTFSQLSVCYIVYRERSVGSLERWKLRIFQQNTNIPFILNTNMYRTVACNKSPIQYQCMDMMGLCIILYVFFVAQTITNATRLSHATKIHCVLSSACSALNFRHIESVLIVFHTLKIFCCVSNTERYQFSVCSQPEWPHRGGGPTSPGRS